MSSFRFRRMGDHRNIPLRHFFQRFQAESPADPLPAVLPFHRKEIQRPSFPVKQQHAREPPRFARFQSRAALHVRKDAVPELPQPFFRFQPGESIFFLLRESEPLADLLCASFLYIHHVHAKDVPHEHIFSFIMRSLPFQPAW